MRYDIPLKDLLWSGAPEFLRQLTGAPVAQLERMEYVLVRRQPDLVARLTDGRLYHPRGARQEQPLGGCWSTMS